MSLKDIIPKVEECAYGDNGVITSLQMGHTQKLENKMSNLRILFKCANYSLRNHYFLTAGDFSPLTKIISTLREYSEDVPWTGEFADELEQILVYRGH